MSSLKDSWKQTGVGLGHAFRDLGKSIVKTVGVGAEKATEWANDEDAPAEAAPDAPAEEAADSTEAKAPEA